MTRELLMQGMSQRLLPIALSATFMLPSEMLVGQQPKTTGSSPQAVLAYREAANFQNNGAFEIAVEEWQKFLKNHANDPLAAKALHYLGVCQLQLKDHAAAAATFAAVLRQHPTFELSDDAYSNLATSQYALAVKGDKNMYEKAAQSYATLLDRSPRTKHREDALFYLGEALYALGRKSEAAKSYERLLKEFGSSKRRADVLYALGVAQEELGNHEAAGNFYDALLTEFPDHALASEVRLRKAETLLQAGDAARAEELFAKAAASKDFDALDHALSRHAYCLVRLNRFAEAAALYSRVAAEFPRSAYADDAILSAGRSYYRAGDQEQARRWLERALQGDGERATEAAHWLCRMMIKSGDPQAAADLAMKESRRAKGSFSATLELDLADALYETPARRAEALSLYTRFVNRRPKHELTPQAQYSAAFTALGLKQYQDALAYAEEFLRSFGNHELVADVEYVAAESQLQLKEYALAARRYADLLNGHRNRPETDAWTLRLGHALLLAKRYDQVVSLLSPGVSKLKSTSMQAEAQFLIGSAHFQESRFPQAAEALSEALDKNPKGEHADQALLFLARATSKASKNDAALNHLQRLLRDFPDSQVLDEAHYRLAELLDTRQDIPAAARQYETVLSRFPESRFVPYSLYGRGWDAFKLKNYESASEAFTTLIDRHADHELAAKSRLGRAMCRRQLGDARGALADLDEYLKTDLDSRQRSEALYERGLALVSLSDFGEAVRTLDTLLKSDPKYPAIDRVLYEMGWALKSQDKSEEAAARFARLAREYPASPLAAESWFHVAEDYYDKMRYEQAEKAYTAARSNATGELAEKATYKLAWTKFQLQDFSSAHRYFDEQLDRFPSGELSGDAVFMKAECLFRQEKYVDAWAAYQASLQAAPSTPTMEGLLLLHAGQTAAQLKKWDESATLLKRLIERQADSPFVAEAHYELGWIQQNQRETADALASYEQAATLSHEHVGARARFMRGELLFEQKKHAEASRDFQRAMYGYGGDDASAETKNWQAKSGYEAGRCAEVQWNMSATAGDKQKYLADARRYYSFVVDKHAAHQLAPEAKKRLAVLSKLSAPAAKDR